MTTQKQSSGFKSYAEAIEWCMEQGMTRELADARFQRVIQQDLPLTQRHLMSHVDTELIRQSERLGILKRNLSLLARETAFERAPEAWLDLGRAINRANVKTSHFNSGHSGIECARYRLLKQGDVGIVDALREINAC